LLGCWGRFIIGELRKREVGKAKKDGKSYTICDVKNKSENVISPLMYCSKVSILKYTNILIFISGKNKPPPFATIQVKCA
jgi:hypothetical protein